MESRKSKTTAALLAFFLGGIGIHRFYLGNTFSGLLYLLFCWTFIPAILSLIDFIVLLLMSQQSFDQRYNPHLYQLYAAAAQQHLPSHHAQMAPVRPDPQSYDGVVGSSVANPSPRNAEDLQFELQALKEMRDDGLLTEDEYQEQRRKILNG